MAVLTIQPGDQSVAGSLGNLTLRRHLGKQVLLAKPNQRSGSGRTTSPQTRILAYLTWLWHQSAPNHPEAWTAAWQMECFALGPEFRRRYPTPMHLYIGHELPSYLWAMTTTFPIPNKPGRTPQPSPWWFSDFSFRVAYRFDMEPLPANWIFFFDVAFPRAASQANPRTWAMYRNYQIGPRSTTMYWTIPLWGKTGMLWRITSYRINIVPGSSLLASSPMIQFVAKPA